MAADETACNEKNKSNSSGSSYILRCPKSTITFGESIVCSYESDTNETISSGTSSNSAIASASKNSDSKVTVTANSTEGTTTVKGVTSGGHQTNGVSITVRSNSTDATNCSITEVKVNEPIVSLNEQSNKPSNSYYIVHVRVVGSGCSKDTLVLTATNSNNVNPSSSDMPNGAGQYSFHVYPKWCGPSKPTAQLKNDGKNIGSAVSGREVTVTGDWQKTTGCYKLCGEHKCTNNDNVYDAFLEADLDNSATGPYYSNWDATDKCYKTKWTRGDCGNSAPVVYACYKDSDGGYHWTSTPNPSWIEVPNVSRQSDCNDETPACYKASNGQYIWGLYGRVDGYIRITAINTEALCNSPTGACYKNSFNDYKWATEAPSECIEKNNCWVPRTDQTIDGTCKYNNQDACEAEEGYKEVTGVTKPEDCVPEEEPACYLHNGEFEWGLYEKYSGYIKVENITTKK